MDEVEKFLDRVESLEFAALMGMALVVSGILACFNSGWKVVFLTLLAGVAVLVVLDGFAWVGSVVAKWEARRIVELIKKDARGRKENVEQKGS